MTVMPNRHDSVCSRQEKLLQGASAAAAAQYPHASFSSIRKTCRDGGYASWLELAQAAFLLVANGTVITGIYADRALTALIL